jgi:hypothetical protein
LGSAHYCVYTLQQTRIYIARPSFSALKETPRKREIGKKGENKKNKQKTKNKLKRGLVVSGMRAARNVAPDDSSRYTSNANRNGAAPTETATGLCG